MHITHLPARLSQQAPAPQPAPPSQPEPPAPPVDDESSDRFFKASVHAIEGVGCIILGALSTSAAPPLGLVQGGLAGLSGGRGYGHVADLFANIMNVGTFQERFALPGAVIGAAAGAGTAWLAAGNPAVGIALGVGCSLPSFLSSYRALKGLE